MKKRILLALLCLMLAGLPCVSATESSEQETPKQATAPAGEMPMDRGRRGGMGGPPSRGEMPAGEMPVMPEGELPAMPEGETWNMPRDEMPQGMPAEENSVTHGQTTSLWEFVKNYETPILSVVLLAFAFVFVLCYKHRNY